MKHRKWAKGLDAFNGNCHNQNAVLINKEVIDQVEYTTIMYSL